MSTYAIKSNLNPIDVGEMKQGEYVLSEDLNSMVEATHAQLYARSNILAYSYQHSTTNGFIPFWELSIDAEAVEDEFYVFTIRRQNTGRQMWMHVWGSNIDLFVDLQDSVTNAWTEIGDGTIGTSAARASILISTTTDSDTDGSDHLHRMRMKLRVQPNHVTVPGKVFGFVLFERLLDPDTQKTVIGVSGSSKTVTEIAGLEGFMNLDTTVAADNSSFDVMKMRRLLNNIATLAKYQVRGCAVVYPRHFRHPLSSIFWRADGPFQWKASPWCDKVSVIVDADSAGFTDWDAGKMGVGAFSSALKQDIRNQEGLQSLIFKSGNVVTSNSGAFTNNVIEINDVQVRAGEWNDIYVSYRGQFLDASHSFDDQRSAAFSDYNEGIVELRFKTDSIDPDPDYVDLYKKPFGTHLVFRHLDLGSYTDGSVGGGGSHSEPGVGEGAIAIPDTTYSELPGEDDISDTFTSWDISCFKGSDGDRHVWLGVSPSPSFRFPENQDRSFQTQICKHGFAFLNSVWINEQYSDDEDILQFATHLRPPPASLNFSYLKLLNNMIDHSWQVNAIRHVDCGAVPTDFGNPSIPVKVSNGCNYIMISSLQERYKSITNPRWAQLAMFPVTLPLDTTAAVGSFPRRIYDKIKFRVNYRIFKMNDGNDGKDDEHVNHDNGVSDNEAAKVRLFVRAKFSDCPGVTLDEANTLALDAFEVDIKDKPSSRLTVQTFTEWDAMVSASKGGQFTSGAYNYPFTSSNQHSWPAEIISEKSPWDVFEYEADMTDLLYGELNKASDVTGDLGVVPEFEFPTWVRLESFFYSYLDGGEGARAASSQGGDKYVLVISGISCVPSNYPLEEIVEEV